jgi:hypothetical protein
MDVQKKLPTLFGAHIRRIGIGIEGASCQCNYISFCLSSLALPTHELRYGTSGEWALLSLRPIGTRHYLHTRSLSHMDAVVVRQALHG